MDPQTKSKLYLNMLQNAANFIRARDLCAPSAAYIAAYTGPADEIILHCGNIEWALRIAFLSIRMGITEPTNGAAMLQEVAGSLGPSLRQTVQSGVSQALSSKNVEAQRIGLLRVLQTILAEYGAIDPGATTNICAAVQRHVDVTKF